MNVIYKTNPKHTEENIPLDKAIEIYFMVDINAQKLDLSKVILLNMNEQRIEEVEIAYSQRVLTVTPKKLLSPECHYQLQLVGGKEGIQDIIGRYMEETYEVEFYSKSSISLQAPIILSPVDMSVYKTTPTIQIQSDENVFYYEIQVSKSNTFQNLEWPINDGKVYQSGERTITPDVQYDTGQYYLRARATGEDGSKSPWSLLTRFYFDGNEAIQELSEDVSISTPDSVINPPPESVNQVKKVVLQAASQSDPSITELDNLRDLFTTKFENQIKELRVKSVSPSDGSVNNGLSTLRQIIIEFTDDIDPNTINSSTCYVLSERN